MAKSVPAVKVLVVDDDLAIRDFMETLLTKDGFEVTAIGDPTKVEDAVRRESFHLVVLDLMMPGMDGIETLERLRKVDSDVAVVIVTGYPSFETAVESMKLEAVDYLRKPFHVDELRAIIERVLRKKGLLRTPEELLYRSIGERLRERRVEKKLSQRDLARRTGLSTSLLSMIERGDANTSLSSLYKVATALGYGMHDLFEGL